MKYLPENSWKEFVSEEVRLELRGLSDTIVQAGGLCYLVGGAVRDLIMQRIPREYDFTTSLPPEKVKALFKRVIETGIKHGTVTVLLPHGQYEVTTFRKDIGYSDGRRPDQVEYGASLEEDLMRRDFTMNALALNLQTLEIIDQHSGLLDIRNQVIRAIGEPKKRFTEDGLRSIRGIRFYSVLGFTIEEETYKAIWETREITRKISVERFQDELYKILKSKHPSRGLIELVKNRIFSLFLTFEEPENYEILFQIDRFSDWIPFRLSFVFLYLTQGQVEKVEDLFRRLKLSKDDTKIAGFWMVFLLDYKQRKESKDILQDLSRIKSFSGQQNFSRFFQAYLEILEWKEDVRTKELALRIVESNPPLVLGDLAINGNDITQVNVSIPKVQYGLILKECLEEVLGDAKKNTKEYLMEFIKKNHGSQ